MSFTREEISKAIDKYQEEHPLKGAWIDVTDVRGKEGADIITSDIERIAKQIQEETEMYLICQMAKLYMQGIRPHYRAEKTGEWIYRANEDLAINDYSCSNCGYWTDDKVWNYCPNCGAKMMKGEEE